MALHWNIESVKDHEEVSVVYSPYEDSSHLTEEEIRNSLKTEALIWLTIGIGMNEITDENAEEFFTRVSMWEAAHGNYLHLNNEDYYMTLADVERRIGLSTNASTLTATKFDKTISTTLRDKAQRIASHQRSRAEREKAAA